METPRRTRKRRITAEVQEILKKIRQSDQPATTSALGTSNYATDLEHNTINADEVVLEATTNIYTGPTELGSIEIDDIVDGDNISDGELDTLLNNGTQDPVVSKKGALVNWAITHNITQTALKDLLAHLRNWLPNENFPVDARTLLKTPRKTTLVPLGSGQFYHFGLSSHIKKFLKQPRFNNFPIPNFLNLVNLENLITFTIGIDGLPISKSSTFQFWPILGKIDQDPNNSVFVISLYYGLKKPDNLENFLGPFIMEMNELELNGFQFEHKNYSIRVRCIVADAPARSLIKNVNQHNAYFGCERCYRRGKWYRNRVTYPIKDVADAYSNESFRQRWYESHHKGNSPLEKLMLDMVFQVPLDYMHLICLGIVKKLLTVWVEGPLPHKLSSKQIKCISGRLESFKQYIPSNFSRKCRGLNELAHFKATEFRTFLLYVGPFALHKILTQDKFEHFLRLHVAIYILASGKQTEPWLAFAELLIQQFVADIPRLYFKEMIVYNFHSLLHITNEARRFGSLDKFSAFDFESYMQKLKRLLRSNSNHLSQVVRRLEEKNNNNFISAVTEDSFTRGKRLSTYDRDNCYQTINGEYCVIRNVSPLTVQKLVVENISWYIIKSAKLGMYKVLNCGQEVQVNLESLRKKCIFLRNDDKITGFVIPLCNSDITN